MNVRPSHAPSQAVMAPLRRGACPALSAPMQTGDGLLIRLSPVSGGLSPKQLIGLCESAAEHGNGIVEVTARGSLQFRGFSDVSAVRFGSEVDALGIVVRTGVPVETSPLAGMDPTERADPSKLAEAVRTRIADTGLSERLGSKVSVVIDGAGIIPMDAIAADVRLTAIGTDDLDWTIALAGDATTAIPLGIYDAANAVECVFSILTEIAALGRAARGRDLVSPPSLVKLRTFARASACASQFDNESGRRARGLSSPSGEGRGVAGEARDGVGEGLAGKGKTPDGNDEKSAPIRGQARRTFPIITLNASQFAFPLALPFGHTDARTLIELAHRAEALDIADIRPAPDRRLLLICPSEAAAGVLETAAAELGFITSAADIRARIAACPGAPGCASGHIAARSIADDLAKALGDAHTDDDLSVHISGCEKGCARQAASTLTIVGGENGAGLVVHGTTRATPLAYRSQAGLTDAIAEIVARLRRSPGTSLSPTPMDTTALAEAFAQG